MRRSVSVVQNSAPAVSESPKSSPQLSKVVGTAMKADSLSRATGKKAERQEGADKGEKGKGESLPSTGWSGSSGFTRLLYVLLI